MRYALLLASLILAVAAQPMAAEADGDAVSFDQIQITLAPAATPPPVDGFATDVALLKALQGPPKNLGMKSGADGGGIDAGAMAVSMVPFVGGFLAQGMSMSKQKAMMKAAADQRDAIQKAIEFGQQAHLTHIVRWNGFERRETAFGIFIDRPDRGLRYELDPHTQTYHTKPLEKVAISIESGAVTPVQLQDVHGAAVAAVRTLVTVTIRGGTTCPDRTLSYNVLVPASDTTAIAGIGSDILPSGCALQGAQPTVETTATYRLFASPDGSNQILFERGEFKTFDGSASGLFEVPLGYQEA
jgi:hypothetical protein